jgi:hypothetical protein
MRRKPSPAVMGWPSTEWIVSIAIAVMAAGVLLLSVWQSGRPRTDSVRARWIPWKFLILLMAAVLLYSAIHMINLAGFKTGSGQPY